MQERLTTLSEKALEMVMRDVLDGLEDFALAAALQSGGKGCQIISIAKDRAESPRVQRTQTRMAEVVDLDRYRKTAAA